MSGIALTWAKAQKAGGIGPKAVLMALACRANEEGQTWASRSLIAEDLECDAKTISRAFKELEARGLILREERHRNDGSRTSDMISLALKAGVQLEEKSVAIQGVGTPLDKLSRGMGDVSSGVDLKSRGVGTESPGGLPTMSSLTTFEPTGNQQGKKHEKEPRPRRHVWPEDFRDQVWDLYGKKVERKQAMAALETLFRGDRVAFSDLMDGIRRQSAAVPEARFRPSLERFIKREKYLDEPPSDGPPPQSGRVVPMNPRKSGSPFTQAIREDYGAGHEQCHDAEQPGLFGAVIDVTPHGRFDGEVRQSAGRDPERFPAQMHRLIGRAFG